MEKESGRSWNDGWHLRKNVCRFLLFNPPLRSYSFSLMSELHQCPSIKSLSFFSFYFITYFTICFNFCTLLLVSLWFQYWSGYLFTTRPFRSFDILVFHSGSIIHLHSHCGSWIPSSWTQAYSSLTTTQFNFSVSHWHLESNIPIETFWSSNPMTFSLSFIPPHDLTFFLIWLKSPDPILEILPCQNLNFLNFFPLIKISGEKPSTLIKSNYAPIKFLNPRCRIWLEKHNHVGYSHFKLMIISCRTLETYHVISVVHNITCNPTIHFGNPITLLVISKTTSPYSLFKLPIASLSFPLLADGFFIFSWWMSWWILISWRIISSFYMKNFKYTHISLCLFCFPFQLSLLIFYKFKVNSSCVLNTSIFLLFKDYSCNYPIANALLLFSFCSTTRI